MGLTIHYSGKLRNPSDLQSLIDEATDIAISMQWHYQRLPAVADTPLDGVLISPEGSEPIWLTFHIDHGMLINPILYSYIQETTGEDIPEEAVGGVFTKTQYAGVETHIAIIKFLRYLSEKYFAHFDLYDESNYWESGDEIQCRKVFARYDKIMDMVGDALDSMHIDQDESRDSVIEKLNSCLRRSLG
ncbi:MAG: hypothetical protein IPP15_00060 [Saprospiraceae bacterium]|uniref:Uncharacterized protein n=1 Tax=Candidatus Opimibacter skivensis TaxID=2982028 RepID=A0A9D7XL73_9BACT|nr:hypothetical protein [Candidatus Opimibacter skivensis]